MTRLQTEFNNNSDRYFFEIKRGEAIPDERIVISNELAGRLLLSFDLGEPYACHQIYKVFDENYAEIFGRREVTYKRIIFLYLIYGIVIKSIEKVQNRAFARYGLTAYFVMYVLGRILRDNPHTTEFARTPEKLLGGTKEDIFFKDVENLMVTVVIDLNYEVKAKGEAFDYKSDLKSPRQTEEWADRLIQSYEKDVARGKAEDFANLI